jgi:hypothetical protein
VPLKKSRTERSATRPKATLSRNKGDGAVRAKIAARGRARPVRNNTIVSVDEAPPQALCDAIEDQRVCLLNVLGAVHCMSIGLATQTKHAAPELSAAFDLVEREIHRVVGGLKEIALRGEMRGIGGGDP